MHEKPKVNPGAMFGVFSVGEPKFPKAPAVPRIDTLEPPTEETIGAVPSITVPKVESDDRIMRLEQAMISVQTDVATLKTTQAGHAQALTALPAIEKQIETVKAHLSKQDATALERDGTINEIFRIVKTRDDRDRERLRESLNDATGHAQLANLTANTKNAEATTEETQQKSRWAWLEHYRGLAKLLWIVLGMVIALGAAAGFSQCEHARSAIAPAAAHE